MEQVEKVILLDYNRKYIEEIYFKDKQGSIVASPLVKLEFLIFIIALTLLSGNIVYSALTNKFAWFIIILALLTTSSFIVYAYKASAIVKWRKGVIELIKKNEVYKTNKLILTDDYFSLFQDENETTQKWSAITHFEIMENYILVTGTVQFLFPKKSMCTEEYNELIQKIRVQVKGTQN